MSRSDIWTAAGIAAVAIVAGGGVYLVTRPAAHAGSATSSATTSGPSGPGPNSSGSATSTGSATTSGPTSTGSATTGIPAGVPNATGGTVTLSAPSAIGVGQTLTLLAAASGITSPLYQFWWREPGSSTWQQTGPYAASPSAAVSAAVSGTLSAVAYARAASAPTGETVGQRAQYEAESPVVTVQVT